MQNKNIECGKIDKCRYANNCPYDYYPQEYYACFDSKRISYTEYINIAKKYKKIKNRGENEYEESKYSEKPKNRKFKFCK